MVHNKKKILIFSLAYYPRHVGGAEVAIKEITDRVPASDIEFHMVTNRFDSTLPKEEKVGNVLVHRIGFGVKGADISKTHKQIFYFSKVLFIPLAAMKAISLNRSHSFDGLWAMMSYMVFPIVLMRAVGIKISYALTIQEGDPFEQVFERWYIRTFKPLLVLGFKRATVVQTISTFLASWAQRMGFSGELEIVPNGVDTAHFMQEYSDNEISKAKKDIGKKDGDVYITTTSRLVKKNGIADVISALPLLDKNIKFIIFGTGPNEEMLKNFTEEKGVGDRTIFWGQIDHAIMPKYLKACDIFTRPSLSEGFGNSFVEAMAADLPVIATQEGGIADFLFDEKRNPEKPTTGWTVDAESPKQITEAVQDIVSNPEKVKNVLITAKKMAQEKYDWNLIAKDMRERVFAKVFK